ncbi:glycine--tRNA ligase [Patescibacteria group bacterium]|nr:glycine--tRNA ligase [Patescibacteria group bacterium]
MTETDLMEKIVSLCKRRGFVYQGSEIYGGLAGTWDYGPLGVALKKNIENLWWRQFVSSRDDMYGLDSSIVMPEVVWAASGHLEGFTDPMVECAKCKHRFRSDQVEGEHCPECKGKLGKPKMFNLLFPVDLGSTVGASRGYLRGEIAQGMFVNFKNIIDSFHPKLPFGIAQSGKAFRNEIAPRDFLFRVREFDLMEFEYFVNEAEWEKWFEYWRNEMWGWIESVGIKKDSVHELNVPEDERAHYSKRTIDFEFDFPFGRKELYGLAYRTNYDLSKHMEKSGVDMQYAEEDGSKFVPHVIEPTFGLGRTVLAVLASAYTEDELGGEKRTYLKLKSAIAPVKAAVFPLLKNKPELVAKAREVYQALKKEIPQVMWDDNGNIGKRYRRQDEIGTPWCITVDFETLEDDTVTVRDRDTGEQERVPGIELGAKLSALLAA